VIEPAPIVPRFVLQVLQGIAGQLRQARRNRPPRPGHPQSPSVEVHRRRGQRSKTPSSPRLSGIARSISRPSGPRKHLGGGKVVTNDKPEQDRKTPGRRGHQPSTTSPNALKPIVLPGEGLTSSAQAGRRAPGRESASSTNGTMVVAAGRIHWEKPISLTVTSGCNQRGADGSAAGIDPSSASRAASTTPRPGTPRAPERLSSRLQPRGRARSGAGRRTGHCPSDRLRRSRNQLARPAKSITGRAGQEASASVVGRAKRGLAAQVVRCAELIYS